LQFVQIFVLFFSSLALIVQPKTATESSHKGTTVIYLMWKGRGRSFGSIFKPYITTTIITPKTIILGERRTTTVLTRLLAIFGLVAFLLFLSQSGMKNVS
jgi:hypothetical protein